MQVLRQLGEPMPGDLAAGLAGRTRRLGSDAEHARLNVTRAIRTAIAHASKTIRNIRWFHVIETRGHVDEGQVAYWQVTLKVGFTIE